MINKLTLAQQSKVKEYYNTYLAKGLSTIPSNKLIAEKAIKRMYQLMNDKIPKIIWVKSITDLISLVNDSSLRSSLRSSLYLSLDSSLYSSLDSSLYLSLRSSLRSSLDSSLRSSLDSSLRSSLDLSLYSSLRPSLRSSLRSSLRYGQTNASWLSFFKYCNEILNIKYDSNENEKLNLWVDMMECSYFFVFKELVILMEHPKEIYLDNQNRNHNLFNYAIKWYDNTGIYVVHGEIMDKLNIEQLLKDKKITNLEYLEAKSHRSEICL